MTEPTTEKTPKRRRPRGEGSTYESADGRWHSAIVVVDSRTGARVRHVTSGRTMAAAQDRMTKLRAELASTGRASSRTTVAEFMTTWLESERARVRAATFRGRRLHVRNYIIPAIGRLRLAELRPSDVERMTAAVVAGGRSGVSARHARATLRRALGDAQRDGLVVQNVAALSRPPKVERHEIRVLTAVETRTLIEGTVDDDLGPVYAIAAATGLRQGEILGLAWSDVDGLDGTAPTLTVRHSWSRTATGWDLAEPKTRRSRRTIELGETVVRILRRQRTRQKEARLAAGADLWQNARSLVFTDSIGRPLTGAIVSRQFVLALSRLGLPRVRFHDLRHGVASMLLAQGVPLKLVSEQLGHSTISITADTYAHLDREQRRAASDAIERAIAGGEQ